VCVCVCVLKAIGPTPAAQPAYLAIGLNGLLFGRKSETTSCVVDFTHCSKRCEFYCFFFFVFQFLCLFLYFNHCCRGIRASSRLAARVSLSFEIIHCSAYISKQTIMCSASYVSWQRGTARICCRAPCCCDARRPPRSIDISYPPARSSKPAAAACSGR